MINTKDIPTGGGAVSKTLSPGNHKVKINSVELKDFPFGSEGAKELILNCEGVDLGEDFKGFFIDKNNESLGRHKGQVGKIKAGKWAFADKDFGDSKIYRDLEVVKFLKNLCVALGCVDWINAQDKKHDTIESLVMAFNEEAPFKDKFLFTCVAGKEYNSKAGYVNYNMFFPKFSKEGVPFENADVEASISKVYKYNEASHLEKLEEPKAVDSFEPASATDQGFELG